jgi:hypothetical protein
MDPAVETGDRTLMILIPLGTGRADEEGAKSDAVVSYNVLSSSNLFVIRMFEQRSPFGLSDRVP